MDNQLIFIIVIVIILICINKYYKKEHFESNHKNMNTIMFTYPFNIKYPSNMINCDIYNNKNDCETGYQCNWIDEKLKAYPLNTPFCSGNIFSVPT
jgi:hypothetical protein